MDIIITHIKEVIPYYLIFESFYYISKRILPDFNTTYFLLHFIVNFINTILLLPLINKITQDPTGNYLIHDDWSSLDIIYPMIIGLHTFHLVHNLNKIYYDEIIHHTLTHIFWYFITFTENPFYIAGIIAMSGIPGGITYAMLFLQKYNIVSKKTEKEISMYLNIWCRAPLCIIFATLLYIQGCKNNLFYETLFMVLFTIINGVHFMHNITQSYYLTNNIDNTDNTDNTDNKN
jgi:hypothetical protein